ncbi:GLPGLI family protein [Galbibacter sp. BG1]|uniref:GLPGLI family protein n=1 Tax=Galbibacter sp. BG1 TaxID=1170699 RepID=UPI0015BEE48E|nr:GLPGLI family protein [Galbibacter sp. BG1]QLE02730.1 GLPGLI family protein [Galbibacter sp. BG1]
MSKKIVLLNFLLFFVSSLFSQSGIVEYKVDYVRNENYNDFAKKLEREMSLMSFQLSYTGTESYYKKLPNVPVDELTAKMATVAARSYENWYQNPKTKIASFNRDIAGTTYLVTFENQMNDWHLSNETKKIEDYVCYKATKKEYNTRTDSYFTTIAWYTPEIPFPYGPSGYGGLPGLILELKYKAAIITATHIILNPDKKIRYPKPLQNHIIDSKQMVKIMRQNRKVTPD